MTRAQWAVTLSAIGVIVAFTVVVKIVASNTTPPKINLPEPTVAPVVMPVAVSAPVAAPPVVTVPSTPTAPAVAAAPTAAPAPAVPTSPVVTPAPAPVVQAAPVVPSVAPETQPQPPTAEAPSPTPEADKREAIAQQRRELTNGAVSTLIAVQQQLNSGDTSGVDQALANASNGMNAVGQGALQQARDAIANKDLTGAAVLINQAVLTASRTQPVQ